MWLGRNFSPFPARLRYLSLVRLTKREVIDRNLLWDRFSSTRPRNWSMSKGNAASRFLPHSHREGTGIQTWFREEVRDGSRTVHRIIIHGNVDIIIKTLDTGSSSSIALYTFHYLEVKNLYVFV